MDCNTGALYGDDTPSDHGAGDRSQTSPTGWCIRKLDPPCDTFLVFFPSELIGAPIFIYSLLYRREMAAKIRMLPPYSWPAGWMWHAFNASIPMPCGTTRLEPSTAVHSDPRFFLYFANLMFVIFTLHFCLIQVYMFDIANHVDTSNSRQSYAVFCAQHFASDFDGQLSPPLVMPNSLQRALAAARIHAMIAALIQRGQAIVFVLEYPYLIQVHRKACRVDVSWTRWCSSI